ncbi:helitron_like_N domain-containing protein [Trichonephila clavipes]|nr:helitron_like_N domain-containing protein [Trichonephila clavipes]
MSTMSQRSHLTDSEAWRAVGCAGRPGQGSRRATTPNEDRYLELTTRRHRNMNATLLPYSPTTPSLGYWYHGFNSDCPKPASWCRSVCSPTAGRNRTNGMVSVFSRHESNRARLGRSRKTSCWPPTPPKTLQELERALLEDQMPRKKSNLNNASTREARRKRIKRAHQLAEQIESRNLAQRISTAEGHAQESQEQCNERLQENIIRTRAAGERDIATSNATEKSNLNNASSKGSRRKRVERAQQLPEQIETRNAAQRIRTAESRARESQEQRDERLQQNITRTRVARERNIATV